MQFLGSFWSPASLQKLGKGDLLKNLESDFLRNGLSLFRFYFVPTEKYGLNIMMVATSRELRTQLPMQMLD